MPKYGCDLEDYNGPVYTALNWIPVWATLKENLQDAIDGQNLFDM